MRIRREEVEAMLRAAAPPPQASIPNAQTLLDQAAVATQQLTGDPLWDVFLQRAQAFADKEKFSAESLALALASPTLTGEQVLVLQRQMIAAKARQEAWEQIIALPKQIMDARAAPSG